MLKYFVEPIWRVGQQPDREGGQTGDWRGVQDEIVDSSQHQIPGQCHSLPEDGHDQ